MQWYPSLLYPKMHKAIILFCNSVILLTWTVSASASDAIPLTDDPIALKNYFCTAPVLTDEEDMELCKRNRYNLVSVMNTAKNDRYVIVKVLTPQKPEERDGVYHKVLFQPKGKAASTIYHFYTTEKIPNYRIENNSFVALYQHPTHKNLVQRWQYNGKEHLYNQSSIKEIFDDLYTVAEVDYISNIRIPGVCSYVSAVGDFYSSRNFCVSSQPLMTVYKTLVKHLNESDSTRKMLSSNIKVGKNFKVHCSADQVCAGIQYVWKGDKHLTVTIGWQSGETIWQIRELDNGTTELAIIFYRD